MTVTGRKLGRAVRAGCPPWLVGLWAVCACVPTPFEVDELLPALVTLAVLVVRPHRRRRAWSAWKGGKSHRLADQVLA